MRGLLRRAWYFLRQHRLDDELAEEMEFHRAMAQREIENRGVDARDAGFAARRAFGSAALAADRSRDVWVPRALQGLGQDFRLAVRTMFANRLVSFVAIVSLALGIGANTAIFSLVNSLMLRALPGSRRDARSGAPHSPPIDRAMCGQFRRRILRGTSRPRPASQ